MTKRWLGPVVVALVLVFSLAAFPFLTERIPTHWNWRGAPDGWTYRWPGAFMLPLISLGVWILLIGLRRIDPRRRHYERFEDTYWIFLNLIVLFISVVHILAIGYALGWPVNMVRAVFALMGLLFIALGNYLPRVRSNWWMGVRTPWTLESETVWKKTHRVAGWTFVGAGLVALAATFLPGAYVFPVALPVMVLAGLVPVVYSYVEWRKERQ